MVFPTNGFDSTPVSVHTSITDHAENDLSVEATLSIGRDGNAYVLSDDQTQALFAAVGDAIKTYIGSQFPSAFPGATTVVYTASTTLTIS